MEHKTSSQIEKLLSGHATGWAMALRGCPDELAASLQARFGSAIGRVQLVEPCRVEHPHSAFLRKNTQNHGRPSVQTTLFAPDGKLTEERSPDGEAFEYFIKKAADFQILRGHLKDVELYPAKVAPTGAGITQVAQINLTPLRELEARWAGLQMAQWALAAQDETAASCLRKLERQFHSRCEEAARQGAHIGILRDMATEPLPDAYMTSAERHIEWMRHAGLAPYVELSNPEPMLLAALCTGHTGVRIALQNAAIYEDTFCPPEGIRFLFDMDATMAMIDFNPETISQLHSKCGNGVILLDCYQAAEDELSIVVEHILKSIT